MAQHYGVDLAWWVRERRVVPLLELIYQLPRASRFGEARLNDPEVARQLAVAELEAERADRSGGKQDWAPDLREWDLHAQLLREIRETLVAVRASVIESTYLPDGNGHLKPLKAGRVAELPAPRSEVDRIKADLTRQRQLEIVALFAPHALDLFS